MILPKNLPRLPGCKVKNREKLGKICRNWANEASLMVDMVIVVVFTETTDYRDSYPLYRMEISLF